MFEAYRQVKINKKWHKYLGIYWNGKVYRYTCLPFGLASAPKIYSEFADTIKRIIIKRRPDLWKKYKKNQLFNYLDDFWAGALTKYEAWDQFIDLLEVLVELGIPTQWRKIAAPAKKQKLLGFMFDILLQILYVPSEKVDRICKAIDELISNRQRTKADIQSIRGKIGWASQVIRASKIFLRGLDATIAKNKKDWKQKGATLTKENIRDLEFWKKVLKSSRNQMTFEYYLRNLKKGDIHIWTDAATSEGTGIGGYTSTGLYFQVNWRNLINKKKWKKKGPSGPELLAVVTIVTYLAKHLENKSIIIHCDNEGVIPMIVNEKCDWRNESHYRLIRYFVSTCFDKRIKYWIEHIPGTSNIEADKLSRFINNPLERLYKKQQVDEHTQPFFDLNPNFNEKSEFYKLDMKQHAAFCVDLARL